MDSTLTVCSLVLHSALYSHLAKEYHSAVLHSACNDLVEFNVYSREFATHRKLKGSQVHGSSVAIGSAVGLDTAGFPIQADARVGFRSAVQKIMQLAVLKPNPLAF